MTAMKVGPLRLYEDCSDPRYRALIAARNPAAWWPMDDDGTGNSLADASGNGYTASITAGGGALFEQPGPQGAPCSFAVEPSPSSYWHGGGLTLGASQHYAVMMTLRNDDPAVGDRPPFATWAGNTGFMLYTHLGTFQVYHAASIHQLGTVPIGDWFHVLWGWDGSTLSMWLNGANVLSAGEGSGAGVGTPAYIGTYDNRLISSWHGAMQHGVVFLDGDADAILNDTDAALLAAAALGT